MLSILTNELDPDVAREYLLNSANRAESDEMEDSLQNSNVVIDESAGVVTPPNDLVKEGVVLVASTVNLVHKLCFWC